MLYDNLEVLKYLNQEQGKLIHLFGESDAGRTQTVFSIINDVTNHDKLCCYFIPQKEEFRRNVFDDTVLCRQYCIVGFPTSAGKLPSFLQLSEGSHLVCIDNFLAYILHQDKRFIRSVFLMLSATAYKNKTNFLLVNDMRYLEEKGGAHPAYQEYFRYFCPKHIQVEKDDALNIGYSFTTI